MKTLTVNFFYNNWNYDTVKAVAYEGTNKYLFEVSGGTVYECLDKIGMELNSRSATDAVNSSLTRRAD